MIVVFRADASGTIGSGHVMRCLTLADGLKAHGSTVSFVCRAHAGNLIAFIESRGYAVDALPAPHGDQSGHGHDAWLGGSAEEDAAGTVAAIRQRHGKADWIVVDHYGIDARWEDLVRPAASLVLAIDDLADRPHACDMLLDQNVRTPVQDGYRQHLKGGEKLLIGPRYLLLRSEFRVARRRPSNPSAKALVFFGGADAGQITLKLLELLIKLRHPLHVSVLVGQSNAARNDVETLCGAHGYEFHASASNVAELIAGCDMAIAACGFFAYELMALRTPALLTAQSDIQWVVAKALEDLGVANAVSPQDLLDGRQLADHIDRTLALSGNAAGFDVVSLDGVESVVSEMERLDDERRSGALP